VKSETEKMGVVSARRFDELKWCYITAGSLQVFPHDHAAAHNQD